METLQLKQYVKKFKEMENQNPHRTKQMARELLKIGRQEQDEAVIAYAEFYIGEACFFVGPRDQILPHVMKSLAYFKKIEDFRMVCVCYNLIGISYSSMEERQLALEYYLKALQLSKEHPGRKIHTNMFYNNIGVLYSQMGNFDESIRYFKMLYKRYRRVKVPEPTGIFNSAYNLADTYISNNQCELALPLVQEIEENQSEKAGYLSDLCLYTLEARMYYGLQQVDEGNEKFDQIITSLSLDQDSFELHEDYADIISRQINLGLLDRAAALLKFLKEFAIDNNATIEWQKVCRLSVEMARKKQDEKSERYWLEQYAYYEEARYQENRNNQLLTVRNKINLNKELEKSRREANKLEGLKLLSERDCLTGLLNRYSLNQLLTRYYERAKVNKEHLGCIFIDLDSLKEYNDTYGHLMGDKCLQTIARILEESEHDNLLFARYGGDEFMGITRGMTEDQMKQVVLEIIRKVRDKQIENIHSKSGTKLTVSIGFVNNLATDAQAVTDYVNHADHALYRAKEIGRNRIIYLNPQNDYEVIGD